MHRYFHISTVFFFLSICFAQASFSSDAYIKVDDNELGQGILRQRGIECLLITPAHVVENALKVDVTVADKTKYPAEIMELFPGDISVLRIKGDESSPCSHASWSNTSNLNALLEKENQGELRTMLADGSIRITPVDIVGYDKYRNINVRPTHQSDAILKGESGSLLYIAGQLSGMLLSVKDGIGNVIRQDVLANTLALFFEDSHQADRQGAHQPNSKTTANPPAQETALTGQPGISGIIAEGAGVEYPVTLQENSPVRLRFSATGDTERYSVEIWDSKHKAVYRNPGKNYSGTESVSIPFTPPRNDTYTLHITGTQGEGKYAVEIQTIALDSQLRSPKNIIRIGENATEGILAQGAVAEYQVRLEENSPVRLEFPATGDTGKYNVEIWDSKKQAVYRDPGKNYSGTDSVNIPFTPHQDDTYTLRIIGTEGEVKYTVRIASIALNAQLRGDANIIQIGGNSVEGVLAQGAVAEYRLELAAYTPVRLNFSATGDNGKYNVEVFDSNGNIVYRDPYKRYSGTEAAMLPLTVSKNDTYLIRLKGIEGECKFSLNIMRAPGKS
ncbi:MAG: hypothetical protein P4L42_10060 [Desulfocapsaceae bacterium]|nr:hypothetical protein [Desulfocapsaceae bacterium]